MSARKYTISLALVVVALLAINVEPINGDDSYDYYENDSADYDNYDSSENKSHHLIVGFRMPGDRIVIKENIVKKSSWWWVVTVEKTFYVPSNERITLVQAFDQKTNGNGAYPSIMQGGPGHNSVTMRFKSQRGHGINFIVELYSKA